MITKQTVTVLLSQNKYNHMDIFNLNIFNRSNSKSIQES